MSDDPAATSGMPTGVLPAPVAGAPFTSRSLAHLELAGALRTLVEFGVAMVPVGVRPSPVYGGMLLADALALRELADHVVVAAVLVEREDGTSWAELGHTDGGDEASARERWADDERAWRADQERADEPADPGSPATATAAELDAWLTRHRPASLGSISDGSVTATLERMDPLRELLHWATRRRAAAEANPPDTQLLARISDREATVYEALTTDPDHESVEHTARAAACRGHAARMRRDLGHEAGGRASTT